MVVVVAAKFCLAAIAETGIEIFGLDGTEGKLFVDFDVKAPACRQGESVLRIRSAAACGVAVATEAKAVSAEVNLEKWPERAGASKGKPGAKHICKITPAKFRA